MSIPRRRVATLLPLACLGVAATGETGAAVGAPEVATRHVRPEALWTSEATSRRGMVVTGSRAASWAGAVMMQDGGNAIDAAVAAAFALGASDPGSSGVGGETYILVRLADGRAVAIDGSSRAPLRTIPEELQVLRDRARWHRSFYGYKAVATPGTVAALALALDRFGTKTLAEVLSPAIAIAEFGSPWTPAHHAFLVKYGIKVSQSAYLSRLFYRDGIEPWDPDHVYCNPDLACFLRRLAAAGASGFYRGTIARELVGDMTANGGWLQLGDLALMEAHLRSPVVGRYRGLEVLSFPYPGGGAAVVEALGILDRLPPTLLRDSSVDSFHALLEANRIAFSDASPYLRPRRPPDELVTDGAHLDARARLVRFDRALHDREISADPLSTLSPEGTTQVSTADELGNVVSLSQTLGAQFGGGAATVGWGFAYNSLINGFDFSDPWAWGYITPLQPPRNNMAPTILVKDGEPFLVIGSAGSARIPSLIVNTIVALVDRGVPPCEATAFPKVLWGGHVDGHTYIELVDPIGEEVAETLARRGFVRQKRLAYPATPLEVADYGGVNIIAIDPVDRTLVGVADPRRQGVAVAVPPGPASPLDLAAPECSHAYLDPEARPRPGWQRVRAPSRR